MGTKRSRIWFFQGTSKDRFLTDDKPKQSTFEDLLESVTFKKESSDRAQEGAIDAELETVVGLVQAATNEQVRNRIAKPFDRVLAVQPHQIPNQIATAESFNRDVRYSQVDGGVDLGGAPSVTFNVYSYFVATGNLLDVFMSFSFTVSQIPLLDLTKPLFLKVPLVLPLTGTLRGIFPGSSCIFIQSGDPLTTENLVASVNITSGFATIRLPAASVSRLVSNSYNYSVQSVFKVFS